ncbi:MAG: zinc ABC transporter substrate-binding protein [Planctomycetota bacterium]
MFQTLNHQTHSHTRVRARSASEGYLFLARTYLICLCAVLLIVTGCKQQPPTTKPSNQQTSSAVYTTFYPTAYFAERIAGDHVKVVNPCPPDADPAFWMPDEQTITNYQNATMIIINGASFEHWLAKVTLPEERIVDTTKPLADKFIVLEGAVSHSHGPGGAHTHEGIDGHTWLDPVNAMTQAEEIHRALIVSFSQHQYAFVQGYADLARDLEALDARLKALAAKMSQTHLLCSHPAYNYLGRRYGWQLHNFHLDPEEVPDEATLKEIKDCLAKNAARYMLWEAPPTAEVIDSLADLGLEHLVFSPAESLDADQQKGGTDYLSIMQENIARLEEAFGTE